MKTHTLELKSKDPFVVLPLKQYESLLEHIEELEDRAALLTRKSEEDVPWEDFEKKFKKKFGSR
ncbi:MAG: hypothetical protein K9J06_07310 [Flavobacteriales bacterium]|nr:hypothetical protein [Flavobacteriales bacterium]